MTTLKEQKKYICKILFYLSVNLKTVFNLLGNIKEKADKNLARKKYFM